MHRSTPPADATSSGAARRHGGPRGRRAVRPAAAAVALAVALAVSPASGRAQQPEPDGHTFPKADFSPQRSSLQRLTAAVQMTRDELTPSRAFTGPASMLADPSDPMRIVAATADLRTRVCHLLVSSDGGRTWRFSKSLPSPDDLPFCTNNNAGVALASIAWGRDGVLYYALQGYDGEEGSPREGRTSIVLARSTDLGNNWKTSLVADDRGSTEEVAPLLSGVSGLAVDTSGDRDVVYVGFTRRYRDAPPGSPLTNPFVYVATSTDGGATFGEPTDLNELSDVTQRIGDTDYPLLMRSSFGAPFVTAHDGVVLVVAGGQPPVENQPPPPPEAGADLRPGTFYAHPHPQLVARSTDRGRSWSITTLGPPIYAGAGVQTGLGWTAEGGDDGTFNAAYAATPETASTTGVADIVVQRSTDGGKTWSAPVAIDDDDPDDYYTSFYPQLSVAPNGRVDVVWQDNREQTDYKFNVRYSYSSDGGATWSPNLKINDRPVDFNYGVSFNSDLRYPPGVASTDHYAAFGWADTRLADELTQTQDVFGAVAQFSPLPATSNTVVPVVAAVFGGLLAAGLVLLLLPGSRRRDAGSAPPPAPAQPEVVGAGER